MLSSDLYWTSKKEISIDKRDRGPEGGSNATTWMLAAVKTKRRRIWDRSGVQGTEEGRKSIMLNSVKM